MLTDVWRQIEGRVGFYTHSTSDQIPSTPGIYAWFYPLWLHTSSLRDLIATAKKAHWYHSDTQMNASGVRTAEIPYPWSRLQLDVSLHPKMSIGPETVSAWDGVLQDPVRKAALEQILMEASIFLPPLYVGVSKSLKQRYEQHVGGSLEDNSFFSRFSRFAEAEELPVKQVADLLFVAIAVDLKANGLAQEGALDTENADSVGSVAEKILLNVINPTFSKR